MPAITQARIPPGGGAVRFVPETSSLSVTGESAPQPSVKTEIPLGPAGPPGPSGAQGPLGQSGTPGTSLLTGNGVPSNDIGNDGDSYIELNTGDVWRKSAGAWAMTGNNLNMVVAPWTGAVARSTVQRLGDFVNINDFGLARNGVTDDSVKVAAAVAAAQNANKALYIPAGGPILMAGTAQVTLQAIRIFGDSQDFDKGTITGGGFGNVGSVFWITDTVNPPFHIGNLPFELDGLTFYWPNQTDDYVNAHNSGQPIAYPPLFKLTAAGNQGGILRNCLVLNCYDFWDAAFQLPDFSYAASGGNYFINCNVWAINTCFNLTNTLEIINVIGGLYSCGVGGKYDTGPLCTHYFTQGKWLAIPGDGTALRASNYGSGMNSTNVFVFGCRWGIHLPSCINTTAAATAAAGSNTITVTSSVGLAVGMRLDDLTHSSAIPNSPDDTRITALNGNILTLSQAIAAPGVTSGDVLSFGTAGRMQLSSWSQGGWDQVQTILYCGDGVYCTGNSWQQQFWNAYTPITAATIPDAALLLQQPTGGTFQNSFINNNGISLGPVFDLEPGAFSTICIYANLIATQDSSNTGRNVSFLRHRNSGSGTTSVICDGNASTMFAGTATPFALIEGGGNIILTKNQPNGYDGFLDCENAATQILLSKNSGSVGTAASDIIGVAPNRIRDSGDNLWVKEGYAAYPLALNRLAGANVGLLISQNSTPNGPFMRPDGPAVVAWQTGAVSGGNTITVTDATGITVDMEAYNLDTPAAIPPGTTVTAVTGNTVTFSQTVTSASTEEINFVYPLTLLIASRGYATLNLWPNYGNVNVGLTISADPGAVNGLFLGAAASGQPPRLVQVGETTAGLEIATNGNAGPIILSGTALGLPSGPVSNRPASPFFGMIRGNSDTAGLEFFYDLVGWQPLIVGAASGSAIATPAGDTSGRPTSPNFAMLRGNSTIAGLETYYATDGWTQVLTAGTPAASSATVTTSIPVRIGGTVYHLLASTSA